MHTKIVAVVEWHLTSYRRTWRADTFAALAQPVLTMLVFGLGLGSYVEDVNGARYLDYIAPALSVVAAFQIAISDATYPVRGGLHWTKIYHVQIATPLRVTDILVGHVAFSAIRMVVSCGAFLLVAVAFGAMAVQAAAVILPIAVLVGLASGLPTFAFSASVSSDAWLEVMTRLCILPMTLFAGVFFPISSLPTAIRPLAMMSPLWHGVELSRVAALGWNAPTHIAGHLTYLTIWAGIGCFFAHRAFRRKLVA